MSQPVFEQFNGSIKKIFKLFKELPSQKFKSKLHISELQSKMSSGMNAEPFYALTILGPLTWRARSEIISLDAAFFLERRYEIEVQQMCKQHNVNYDDAINTINFMKDAYRSAPTSTQQIIFAHLKDLVVCYAKHVEEVQKSKTH